MPVNTYITANGRIRRRITTNGGAVTDQVAVVTNALGSVVATYKDGWLTADRSYDPYGETRAEWNDVGRFGWVGGLGYRETRREWVSHYVRARHYGFPMGMWASVDPLWPSEAAFGYVGGMASKDVDPTGTQQWSLIAHTCRQAQSDPCASKAGGATFSACIMSVCIANAGKDLFLIFKGLKKVNSALDDGMNDIAMEHLRKVLAKAGKFKSLSECCQSVRNSTARSLIDVRSAADMLRLLCNERQKSPGSYHSYCAEISSDYYRCLDCCDAAIAPVVPVKWHDNCRNSCISRGATHGWPSDR